MRSCCRYYYLIPAYQITCTWLLLSRSRPFSSATGVRCSAIMTQVIKGPYMCCTLHYLLLPNVEVPIGKLTSNFTLAADMIIIKTV